MTKTDPISVRLWPSNEELVRRWQRARGMTRSQAINDLVRLGKEAIKDKVLVASMLSHSNDLERKRIEWVIKNEDAMLQAATPVSEQEVTATTSDDVLGDLFSNEKKD